MQTEILSIATGIASIILGGTVLFVNPKRGENISLFLYMMTLSIWLIGQGMGGFATDKESVYLWTRINLLGAVFIPLFHFTFIISVTERIAKEWLRIKLISFVTAILAVLVFTPLFIADVRPVFLYKYYPVAGPAYFLFVISFLVVLLPSFYRLFLYIKESSGQKRNQGAYVLFASTIGFFGGATAFFPAFNIPIPSIAHFVFPIYISILVFAVLKHNLLDVRILISNGIKYSVLTLVFTTIYSIALIFSSKIFADLTGMNSFYATIIPIFIFVIIFEPLRQRIYASAKTLEGLSLAMVSIFDKEKLISTVESTIKNAMELSEVKFLQRDVEASWSELSMPVSIKGRGLGKLCIGKKNSGDNFSKEDIALLSALSNHMAVALDNADLYSHLLQGEKLSNFGNIAAGLAHEIKNPLASIKGMTQILKENLDDSEFVDRYIEIMLRQVDRINDLVETLLQIGKPQKSSMLPVHIDKILNQILELVDVKCMAQSILIEKDFNGGKVSGNSEQLTQAFMNIILNGIDAMPNGGKLFIKTENDRKKTFITIKDTGTGIKKEEIKNIFDPFFTTKTNGTGLGLSLFYRIISEHGGRFEVESKEGDGTGFKIWLYTKQKGSSSDLEDLTNQQS